MRIGKLIKTNSKGQFVIPQEYREMLGITPNVSINIVPKYNGLFLEPVSDFIPIIKSDDMYENILKSTKGSWGKLPLSDKDKEEFDPKISKERKKVW